jgi:hypothetical protein
MKLTKKILIGSLAAFALAMLTGCPGNNPDPKPENTVENKLGKMSGNLLDDGDAEGTEGEIYKMSSYNLEREKVEVEGGHAWKVVQTGKWGELIIDLTEVYAPGKSFLISAKVKNNPDADSSAKNCAFAASYTVYSGAVKNWADAREDTEHYDFDPSENPNIISPWDGEKDTTGADYDCDDFPYTADDFGIPLQLSDSWQEVRYIIPATEIDKIVDNSGLYELEIAFSAGKDADAPYSYLIDDITIIDLNSEIEPTGQTWVDPNAPDPEEE